VSEDVITRVAPLGLRFVDDATGAAVRDGLAVAWRVAGGAPVPALPTHADVFVVRGIPGLRASEQGAGDEDFWARPPARRAVAVEVGDPQGRYAAFSFAADAPARGLFAPPCAGRDATTVPLLPAATRSAPAGMALVRAELRDAASGEPAAFAVLEVDAGRGGPQGRGFADAEGRVAALLAWPRPPSALSGGPQALAAATWEVGVSVRSRAGVADGPFPDLCDVLGQPLATPLAATGPDTPLRTATLAYGRELVLRTAGETVLLVNR